VVRTLEQALATLLMGTKAQLKDLSKALQDLGTRHVSYGVHPQHFQVVETALLRTLETGLGKDNFSEEERKSWAAIFKFLSKAMIEGSSSGLEIIKASHQDPQVDKEALTEQIVKLRLMMIIEPTPKIKKRDSSGSSSRGSQEGKQKSSSPDHASNTHHAAAEQEFQRFGRGRRRFLQSSRSDSNLVARRRRENCLKHISVLDFQFQPKDPNFPSPENSFRDLDGASSIWGEDLSTTMQPKQGSNHFDSTSWEQSFTHLSSSHDESFSTLQHSSRAAMWGEGGGTVRDASGKLGMMDNAPRLPGSRRKSYDCLLDCLDRATLESLQTVDSLPKVPKRQGSMGPGRNKMMCRMRGHAAQMDPPRMPRRMVREDIETSDDTYVVKPPKMPQRRRGDSHADMMVQYASAALDVSKAALDAEDA
jgi:hypothetical protein